MRLGGIVKSSTLDFPGIVSAVLFTQGCNFTCPYCHNPHLVRSFGEPLDEGETLVFLRQRRPLLDGVVISGGEPTIQPDIIEFCKKIRGLGYMLKLDTNGSKPDVLAELMEKKLINYLALDLKADPNNYPVEIGPEGTGRAVMETIALLKKSGFPHEFRTTAAAPFINAESIVAVAKAAAGAGPLYIQQCRLDNVLNPEFMAGHVQPTMNDLKTFYSLTKSILPTTIRGQAKP